MPFIAIMDYGVGNLRSIQKALEKNGAETAVANRVSHLRRADGLILPGVGAFRDAMRNLRPLKEELTYFIDCGKPVLGICLGLQLLFTSSVEGGFCNGLNVLKGKVVKLPEIVKVPHMGWNSLRIVRENPLLDGLPDRSYVYFAHSYYASAEDSSIVAATTSYGVEFPSVIFSKYVYGTQFHPEKSGEVGQIIIKNFVDLARR